uniref:Uncharacterized protein n=1 Tax=Aegilops tauschii subsp. strangulata TaxID=200361 RepID=A0A453AMV2_AEGTS
MCLLYSLISTGGPQLYRGRTQLVAHFGLVEHLGIQCFSVCADWSTGTPSPDVSSISSSSSY